MDNMRRMLPAPSLRMSEGGMFDSLKRAVGVGPKETIQQKFAREDAALKAKMAASAPAPAAAPAPKAVSNYVGNSALEGRMKAAGLRDGGDLRTGQGGHVPGSGSGDKIPAKYEPGEFVVSNDMLDAAPQLREQLHGLRGQVLAEKGMTPEQADAKALSGTGLRAAGGFSAGEFLKTNFPNGAADLDLKSARTGAGPAAAPAAAPQYKATSPLGAAQHAMYDESPEGKATSRAYNQERAKSAGVGSKYDPASAKGAPIGVEPAKGSVSKLRPGSGPGLIPTAAAGFAGSWIADKMRNIGNPDNEPATAPRPKTADDLRHDALVAQIPGGSTGGEDRTGATEPYNFFRDNEVGRNVGNTAQALSMVPIVGGAGAALRASTTAGTTRAAQAIPLAAAATGGAAEQLRNGSQAAAAAPITPRPTATPAATQPAATQPAATRPAATQPDAASGPSDADMLRSEGMLEKAFQRDTKTGGDFNMNDGINTLRSDPSAMALANKAWAGRGVQASFDSKGGLVLSGAPGGSQGDSRTPEQIANGERQLASATASLRNPDGSTWSANDNAIMAANLRDGADPYRGTSRAAADQAAANKYANMPIKTARAMRVADAQDAAAARRSAATDATTRRGQDIDYERAMAPARLAQQQRQMRAQIMEQAGGNLRKATDIGLKYGIDVKDWSDLESLRVSTESTTQATGIKAKDQLMKEFTQFDADNKEDPAATQQVTNMVRQLFPGIDQMAEGPRNAAMADAKEMAGIFAKARTNDRVGWEATKFWKAPNPTLNNMPTAKGMQTEQVGFGAGVTTIGASNGDTLLKRPDGTQINLGRLNSRQLELLERAQKTGWGS